MADLYGTTNNCSFSSSSSLESEDMSNFLQSFLNNPSSKDKFAPVIPSPSQISTGFLDSDHRFSDLSSFYSSEANQVKFSTENDGDGFGLGCQVQKMAEGRQSCQNSNPQRSSKRTRAAEIHNMSEKRRRSRINEKLKALQTLVPNSNKTDKASMLDEAIEYLKQLQLKVQTLTMRNGYGLPPVYSQEQEMQMQMQMGMGMGRGMGMGYEGYKLPNTSEGVAAAFSSQNQGSSARREFGIMPNHIGMLSSTNMVKPDPGFSADLTNVNQYEYPNHSTSMKDMNRGEIASPGVSS